MTYEVRHLKGPNEVDARWDKAAWQASTPLELRHHMGQRPEHFPRVQARIAYDDGAIYLIFKVDDRYVRAVAGRHQGHICADSCVEFFFCPSGDAADGYMNIEMNCGGTMLFHYQRLPRKGSVPVELADLEKIRVAHTLPQIVEPEIKDPTTWVVEYRIPFDVVSKYVPNFRQPAPGVTWTANLYKCGDNTSQPHWLTWSPVMWEKPNFHLPEQFATLRFE